MKNILKQLNEKTTLVLNWLMFSSQDSTKFASTVKGSAVYALIVAVAPLLHFNGAPELIDKLISLVVAVGQVASAVWAIYGAMRKVGTTLGGTNAVLNDRMLNN